MKKTGLVFILCAVLFNGWAQNTRRPKKVIFLIGDGMGLAQISAAMSGYSGRNAFERFQVIGLSKTSSADDYVTDSGAGATVFTIGKKTKNGSIGVDANGATLENLFEKLKKAKKSTGVVVTSSVTHATPAAFYAHVASRNSEEDIAKFMLNGTCDIVIGGGINFFRKRSDGSDLFPELNKIGMATISDSIGSFLPRHERRFVYLLAPNGMKKASDGRGNYLKLASENAIGQLNLNQNGFMLMIEGSQIDWGGHAMDFAYMKSELLDFNETINMVLDMAAKDPDMLVLVTADHETGGLTLNQNPDDVSTFKPTYSYSKHTGIMVPVFAYGASASAFSGIYENTEIFYKLKFLMGLK